MRRWLLLMIGVALLFGTPTLTLAATGTSGTTAGEKVVIGGDAGETGMADTPGDIVATFRVGGSGTKSITCVVATVTVGQVYGGKWGTLTDDQNGLPATVVNYGYQLFNLGNATDVFSLLISSGLPSGWSTAILKNGAATSSLTIAEDAMSTFTVQVTIPSSANDNDKGTFTVTASTSANDGAAYIVEPWQYGGNDTLTDSATTTCSSAIIAMTKTYSVGTVSGYTGSSINIPGSLITYCIEYRNIGSAVASDVTVTAMLPRHTTYVTQSIRMGTGGAEYAGAVGKTDATGDDEAQFGANIVQFNLSTVGIGISGRLYYQVRID